MKAVILLVILALLPVILASRDEEDRWEEREPREKRVSIPIRYDRNGRLSVVNVRTENNRDDDDEEEDDDDDDDNNDDGEVGKDKEKSNRDSVAASGNNEDDDDDDDRDENSASNYNNNDDDDEEGKDEAQKVVCKRRCAPPLTFDQCANPRCAMKHSIVKELCYYLCKHQQVKCRETCEPE